MMTCTYDFRWRHIYVKCPITSGSHILEPQNLTFSFPHNFTKKYFFSKVRLIPDSTRSDLSKEPIKSGYLCKSAKKSLPWKPVLTVRSPIFGYGGIRMWSMKLNIRRRSSFNLEVNIRIIYLASCRKGGHLIHIHDIPTYNGRKEN